MAASEQQSPVEFGVAPVAVKIPAGTQAVMLNISAKLKNSFLLAQENLSMLRSKSHSVQPLPELGTKKLSKSHSLGDEDEVERQRRMLETSIEKYSHLLVGKVRDSQIMFAFFIEASIIDVSDATGAAAAQ